MNKHEMYLHLSKNPKNIRFELLCTTAEKFGFVNRGGKGSHRIFIRDNVNELLNFQNVDGKAKAYQVRQFCKILEKYSLQGDERDA